MTHSVSLPPSWRAYADQVVARLAQYHYPFIDKTKQAGTSGGDTDLTGGAFSGTVLADTDFPGPDPDDWPEDAQDAREGDKAGATSSPATTSAASPLVGLLASPGYPHLPPDLAEDLRAAGLDPEAVLASGETRPARPLPLRELLLTLRLAAGLGDARVLHSASQPGALTLITGIAPADLDRAAGLISRVMLPKGIRSVTELRRDTSPDCVTILAPAATGDAISSGHRGRFRDEVARALTGQQPLILLAPDAQSLPRALREAIPSTHHLAPLDREILIAHLRHSHSATGRIDEAAIRALLPEDPHLAHLDPLALALRQPSAAAVARHIAERSAPATEDGPRLEPLTGASLALTAARRLIADLRLCGRRARSAGAI